MPSAVSSSASANRLGFFFLVMLHLLYQSVRDRARERASTCLQPSLGDIAQGRQLIVVDVLALALGKAKEEHGARLGAVRDQHAIAARPSFSGPRHPLLEDAAAEIGIDQAALGPPHRLAKTRIGNPLAARKAREQFRLEYPQSSLPAL